MLTSQHNGVVVLGEDPDDRVGDVEAFCDVLQPLAAVQVRVPAPVTIAEILLRNYNKFTAMKWW